MQILTAAYATGAVIVQAVEGGVISRGEKYPIVLNWEKIFGSDLSFLKNETDIGTHHLAGIGATGTWMMKTMELMKIKGKILGYDKDIVSEGNLQRTTFEIGDVGTPKVIAFQKSFSPRGPNLIFTPIEEMYSSSDELHENVITCVDSRVARRKIQDFMPLRTFDCSTTDISEVSLFFGGLSVEEPCLGCVYDKAPSEDGVTMDIASALGIPVEEVKKGFIDELAAIMIHQKYPEVVPSSIIGVAYDSFVKSLCGQGQLKPSDEKKVEDVNIAPLCHVSAIAGIFLAIEIKRRFHFGLQKNQWNYWKINPWSSPVPKIQKNIQSLDSCVFHKTLLEVSLRIWAKRETNQTLPLMKKKKETIVMNI